MKATWQLKTVRDVAIMVGGGTPDTNQPEYWDGNIPWVSPKDMKATEIWDSQDHITDQAIKNSAASLVKAGAVLVVVRSGILARTVPMAVAMTDVSINQDLKALVPRSSITSEFLFFALQAQAATILSMASRGATVHRLPSESLLGLRLPVPAIREQQRIVATLHQSFAAIAAARANTEQNLRSARELFDSHLQGVFTQRGQGWIDMRLGTAFATVTGTTPPKNNPDFYGHFMPFVKPPELRDAVLDSADDGLSELGTTVARTAPSRSVLVSCIGNLGKAGLNSVRVAFNQQINAIVVDETKAVPEFMFMQALSSAFRQQLDALASGTTVPIVNKSKFDSITIAMPPIADQLVLAQRLQSLRERTQYLESVCRQKLSVLDEMKQSLLHQAFTDAL